MTRFGEIPPPSEKFGPFLEGLFCVGQNVEPTWGKFLFFWAKFHCCIWPNIEQIIWSSGHTDARPIEC